MKKVLIAAASIIMLFTLTFTAVSASSLPFTDVPDGKWYTKAITFCYENGYMNGTSKTQFSPNVKLSRGMVVTIFGAVDAISKDDYYGLSSFSDVPAGKWYSSPVQWAYENGVVAGYGSEFKPNNNVTREELAVMMMAFAKYAKVDVSARVDDLSAKFSDAAKISKWAKNAISWAVASGIISGNEKGEVNPKGNATRAETAVMLYKLCKLGVEKAKDFTVSRAFGDHMTLQRDKQLSVWGFASEADEGKRVVAEFKGEKATAFVKDGEWKAVFDKTFEYSSSPDELYVSGRSEVSFTDVLVGDVYYVMGQSNVYWPTQLVVDDLVSVNEDDQVADLTYDKSTNIRLFRNSHVFQAGKTGEDAWGTAKVYKDVDSEYAVWARPDDFDPDIPFNINTEFVGGRSFSAIGYMFALDLARQTDVPIAMIEIDASGYPLTAWAPNELADKWNSDTQENGVYYEKIAYSMGNKIHSRMAYNQQLHPLMNFSCAGILWYQGESDMLNTIYNWGKETWTFSNEITDLMTYFRTHMGDGKDNFPVYFVEFPACFSNNNRNAYLMTGIVRSELGCVPCMLDNSFVVASSDMWDNEVWYNNIHPYCKPGQAQRAANMVLANEYGKGDINMVAGPQLESVEYEDNYTVLLTFKYVANGLKLTTEDFSNDIYGLEVLTSKLSYSNWAAPAQAEIVGKNQVRVKHNMPIYGVRYDAVTEYYYPTYANLGNSEDIPMVAFACYK
ncbi:MAG: S-layer homology domain-containing protein [Clostridia bacterium]|nr:S-layer homology domain-containing protein [Clostridia bacterium]